MHIQMNSYHNKEKLILSNVSKSYNNTLVLEDINIKVNEGELVTILGPSGSGKSTIFNIITNLTQKDNGNVYIDGKISYMQQKDLLLPYKTIIDNVSLPLILNKENKIDIERTKELIDLASGLKVTFHMAFDEIDDKFEALNQLISMNVDRVLTKGCKTCALDGKNTLKNLVEKSDNRITILVGGGVTYKNYKELSNYIGCNEMHGSKIVGTLK